MIDKVKCNVVGAESWFSLRVLSFLCSTHLVHRVDVVSTYEQVNCTFLQLLCVIHMVNITCFSYRYTVGKTGMCDKARYFPTQCQSSR